MSKPAGVKDNPESMAASQFLRNANAIHEPMAMTSGKSGEAQTVSTILQASGLEPSSKAITDSPAATTQNESVAKAINCETINQIKVTMLRSGFAVSSVIFL